jgi:hypothetical protein
MTPDQAAQIIGWLRSPWFGALGIHTHDNMGLAVANTLCAIDETSLGWIALSPAWGGLAMLEFLYVDDMAKASVFVMIVDKHTYEKETQPMLSNINLGLTV